jgi:hypothetical protein
MAVPSAERVSVLPLMRVLQAYAQRVTHVRRSVVACTCVGVILFVVWMLCGTQVTQLTQSLHTARRHVDTALVQCSDLSLQAAQAAAAERQAQLNLTALKRTVTHTSVALNHMQLLHDCLLLSLFLLFGTAVMW